MAQQGLFTQGTSVQDLMADRRQRGTDLQNMLMQQAAQGARNPVRAQGASMLGSILGRSLAGAMGGQDTEMEKLKERNEQQAAMQKQYGSMSQGTGIEQMEFAKALNAAGYSKEAAQIASQAKGVLAEEAQIAQDEQDRIAQVAKDDIVAANNERLAKDIESELPVIAESVRGGDAGAIRAAYAFKSEKVKAKQKADTDTPSGTAADQDYKSLRSETTKLDGLLALPDGDPAKITEGQYQERIRQANMVYGGGVGSYQKKMGEVMATQLGKLTEANHADLNSSSETRDLINDSKAILDRGLYTGVGAQGYYGMQKLLIGLGAPVSLSGAADSEKFRSNSMEFVLDYIAQTKGAISNAEMVKFEKAAMGIGNTVLGNRLILEAASQANDFRRDRATHMDQWFDQRGRKSDYPTPNEYATEQRKWEDDNQITLRTPDEIQAMVNESAIVDGATGDIVKPNEALSEFNAKYQ